MSISYNWTISETNYQVANGYVFCAHWQATAVDGEHTASIYSTCSWADDTVNTPYDQLTQETVLGWVWANGVDKTATEAALAAQIEAQKNPVTATGTPWGQT
jgi:hypothetical protein